MLGLSLETCLSNLKSIPLTVLQQLAFNAQQFRGHVTLAKPPFKQFLRDRVRTVTWIMHVKFEVSIFNHVGTIVAFNPQEFRGSCALSEKF